jgi:hypothetical protein
MIQKHIIELKDGLPHGHPYELTNFMQTYPEFNYDELPTDKYAKFVFKFPPREVPLKPWETIEYFGYQIIDGVVSTRYEIVSDPILEQELRAAAALEESPYVGWVFDNDYLLWIPPIPRPDDGNEYVWNNETVSWMLASSE